MGHGVGVMAGSAGHDHMGGFFQRRGLADHLHQVLIASDGSFIDLFFYLKLHGVDLRGKLTDLCNQFIRFSGIHVAHLEGALHFAGNHIFRAGEASDGSHSEHQRVVNLPAAPVGAVDEPGHGYHGVTPVFHHGGPRMVAVSHRCHTIAHDPHDSADHPDLQVFIKKIIALLDMEFQVAFGVLKVPFQIHDLRKRMSVAFKGIRKSRLGRIHQPRYRAASESSSDGVGLLGVEAVDLQRMSQGPPLFFQPAHQLQAGRHAVSPVIESSIRHSVQVRAYDNALKAGLAARKKTMDIAGCIAPGLHPQFFHLLLHHRHGIEILWAVAGPGIGTVLIFSGSADGGQNIFHLIHSVSSISPAQASQTRPSRRRSHPQRRFPSLRVRALRCNRRSIPVSSPRKPWKYPSPGNSCPLHGR